MREIKFRAWDKKKKKLYWPFDIWEAINSGGKMDEEIMELMESTGLRDKNRKEIYEGDIVKCEGLILEVEYVVEPAIAGFVFNRDGQYIEYAVKDGVAIHYEIIGNIYENPELIKK